MHLSGRERRPAALGRDNASGELAMRRHRPDYWIMIIAAILMAIGIIVVYSISPGLAASRGVSEGYYISKQLIAVGLGILSFFAAAYIPVNWWKKAGLVLIVAAILASIVAMATPLNDVYRAHRWVRFSGLSFQVAELIKLALLVWAAGFLTMRWRQGQLNDANATQKPLLILILVAGVIVAKLQSDLGSMAVIVAMLVAMGYAVGIPLKRVALVFGVILIGGILAISTSSYRRERLLTFTHPEKDCQAAGYQACQALIAVGSGGLVGKGLGHGVQAYGYLPEASNDSIFAVMAEKFGFFGSSIIVTLIVILFARIKRVIEHTSDQFSRLLAVGVLAWLSTQAIINIGAMIGLLPLKGITLPLISYGGTSLLFVTAALGIVYQVSRYTSYSVIEPETLEYENENNGRAVRRGIGRAYNPKLVSRPRT